MRDSHDIIFRGLFIVSLVVCITLSGCRQRSSRVPTGVQTAEETTDSLNDPVSGIQSPSDKLPNDSAENNEMVSVDPYDDGIIPAIREESEEYAEALMNNPYNGFIIVDKGKMRVSLYDRYGVRQKSYGMACAKNYGDKHKKADSRTPEGFFSVEGVYDSEDWLFTDDDGYTSPKKGQFGPKFIRIRIPVTSQIGIHGTSAPWSIGGRSSHGCIRIKNENILELAELVEPGMPVIIVPGKKDMKVNLEEGSETIWIPSVRNQKRPLSDKEKMELKADTLKIDKDLKTDSVSVPKDTIPMADTIPAEIKEVKI